MDEYYIPIDWQDGNGESVEIGYLDPKGKVCKETLDLVSPIWLSETH